MRGSECGDESEEGIEDSLQAVFHLFPYAMDVPIAHELETSSESRVRNKQAELPFESKPNTREMTHQVEPRVSLATGSSHNAWCDSREEAQPFRQIDRFPRSSFHQFL